MERIFEIAKPDSVMLSPFDYVMAMVGGTRRRFGVERFRGFFPLTVRCHPDVFLAVAAHPLCRDGVVLTADGPIRVKPDSRLRKKEVQIDPRKDGA